MERKKSGSGKKSSKTGKEKPTRAKRSKAKKRSVAKNAKNAGMSRSEPSGGSDTRGSTQAGKARNSSTMDDTINTLIDGLADLTGSAWKAAAKTREVAEEAIGQVGKVSKRTSATQKSSRFSPEQLRRMAAAGDKIRDLREVAGLTLDDLTRAMKIKDKSIMQAVEDGREAMSLEVMLRLASLFARNDPVPFILNLLRAHRPQLWEVLQEFGFETLTVKLDRERRILNLYRSQDTARKISDEGFDRLLTLTSQVFILCLELIAEQEGLESAEKSEVAEQPQELGR